MGCHLAIAGGSVDRKEDGALIGQGMTAVLAWVPVDGHIGAWLSHLGVLGGSRPSRGQTELWE